MGSSRRIALTDGPPLYRALDYGGLQMPLHGKAIVAGLRHLNEQHGDSDEDARERSSLAILRRHLVAHELAPETAETMRGGTPWNLVAGPHRLANERP